MLPDDDALLAFRRAFGRLCMLTARALKQGFPESFVSEAARGKGDQLAPVYIELRLERERSNRRLALCMKAGIPGRTLAVAALEARTTAEQEWLIRRLPRFSEASP